MFFSPVLVTDFSSVPISFQLIDWGQRALKAVAFAFRSPFASQKRMCLSSLLYLWGEGGGGKITEESQNSNINTESVPAVVPQLCRNKTKIRISQRWMVSFYMYMLWVRFSIVPQRKQNPLSF